MRTHGRKLLLVLIILWLPLQGTMAASMSLCISAKPDKPIGAAADQRHNDNHEHSMQDVKNEVTSNPQCDGGLCQSSCTAPIPSVASEAIFVDSPTYTLSFASPFTLLFPEQLQRPPLV